jgi:hypothetical protein
VVGFRVEGSSQLPHGSSLPATSQRSVGTRPEGAHSPTYPKVDVGEAIPFNARDDLSSAIALDIHASSPGLYFGAVAWFVVRGPYPETVCISGPSPGLCFGAPPPKPVWFGAPTPKPVWFGASTPKRGGVGLERRCGFSGRTFCKRPKVRGFPASKMLRERRTNLAANTGLGNTPFLRRRRQGVKALTSGCEDETGIGSPVNAATARALACMRLAIHGIRVRTLGVRLCIRVLGVRRLGMRVRIGR